jgi:hypothetical protein
VEQWARSQDDPCREAVIRLCIEKTDQDKRQETGSKVRIGSGDNASRLRFILTLQREKNAECRENPR